MTKIIFMEKYNNWVHIIICGYCILSSLIRIRQITTKKDNFATFAILFAAKFIYQVIGAYIVIMTYTRIVNTLSIFDEKLLTMIFVAAGLIGATCVLYSKTIVYKYLAIVCIGYINYLFKDYYVIIGFILYFWIKYQEMGPNLQRKSILFDFEDYLLITESLVIPIAFAVIFIVIK